MFSFIRILLLFFVAGFLPANIALAANTDVIGFRSANHKDFTRIVFDMHVMGQASYKAFTLDKPHRLVVDIKNGNLVSSVAKHLPNYHFPLFERVRYGYPEKHTLRMVFDLAKTMVIRDAFIIKKTDNNPTRLVIDVSNIPNSAHPVSPRKKTKKPAIYKPLIVVDAGHGGRDPGAIGRHGTKEKDVTLEYAKALRQSLLNTGKFRVVLTRDRDFFIPLRGRVSIARRTKGDMFISLHANAHKKRKVRGFSVYTLSDVASDKEAAALARKENASGIIESIDLSIEDQEIKSILIDLAQRDTKNQSSLFADLVVQDMSGHIKMLRNPHRFAGFRVLKAPDIPAILVEIGYLTNSKEERLLNSDAYRKKLISRITHSVAKYFDKSR